MNNMKICSIKLNGVELTYMLKRSSRKTIGIQIDKNGKVVVASPQRVSESYIDQLLIKKAGWIYTKIQQTQARVYQAQNSIRFQEGECLVYMGKKYKIHRIQSSETKKPDFKIEDGYFAVYYSEYDSDKFKEALKGWYVERFKEFIEESTSRYSKIVGARPQKITIRDQKTRWGSCSAKGNINLNWRLIMSPPEIIEYVIVHELCHLRQMNHSAEFWKLVESIIPSYKQCRKWLKENGDTLIYD